MMIQTLTFSTPRNTFDLRKPVYLTKEFLTPWMTKEPPFGALGAVVVARTYARFVPSLKRREFWWEICMRVTEYSMSLFPREPRKPASFSELREEAEDLFGALFDCMVFAAGRTMFVGGTQVTEATGDANFNCTFVGVSTLKSFSDAFHWLLVGAGVGFSVEHKYVSNLPLFYPIELIHAPYTSIPPKERAEQTKVVNAAGLTTIIVGDSKEGWESALTAFLDFATVPNRKNATPKRIHIVYDSVRPAGERLKTFGGRASGAEPLKLMFDRIAKVINRRVDIGGDYADLHGVDAMDIMNAIAAAVVVGGVRRSAQIALGDAWDDEFIEAKKDLWFDEAKAEFRDTRVLSNNSVHFWEKPDRLVFDNMFTAIETNGEPGIIIAENAAKRRPNYAGVNPCAEIMLSYSHELRAGSTCNLAEVNLMACIDEKTNTIDEHKVYRATYHASRMCSRMTNVTQWDKNWDYVQKRDRLLGVSHTGTAEAFATTNMNPQEQKDLMRTMRSFARNIADAYHNDMGIPKALLVTTGKPSGSVSKIPTVSSGCHLPYAPYYICRIRVSAKDPCARALYELGVPVTPDNNLGNDLFAPSCHTWVFSFYVKSNATIKSIDEPAITQLERYKMFMTAYVDHNQSVTITVAPDEWKLVREWVWNNWEYCVGLSFLPRFDPSTIPVEEFAYPTMPLQTCTKEEYEANVRPTLSEKDLLALIAKYEVEYEEYELDAACSSSGFCPIR